MNKKTPPESEPVTPIVAGNVELCPATEHFVLYLFVAGLTSRSTLAVERIRSICDMYLAGRHELIVIDLYLHPEQAQRAQIVVVPTLVKQLPVPVRLFVGDMADTKAILNGLNIAN